MSDVEYRHLYGKAKDAKIGGREDRWPRCLGGAVNWRKVAVALVLNRADWLDSMGYTLAEAIARTGPEWIALVPRIEIELRDDNG